MRGLNPNDAMAVELGSSCRDRSQRKGKAPVLPERLGLQNETPEITMIDLGNGAWIRRLPGA